MLFFCRIRFFVEKAILDVHVCSFIETFIGLKRINDCLYFRLKQYKGCLKLTGKSY